MKPLFCPTYLPNVAYFAWMLKQEKVFFCEETFYQKQTYRNRSEIYGANGKLKLTIPIRHTHSGKKPLDGQVQIAYDMDWQKQHWKSICTAYRSSPYFEFYETDFAPYYRVQTSRLFEFNLNLIKLVMELIESPFAYEIIAMEPNKFKPKDELLNTKQRAIPEFENYTQVFSLKFGFLSNLSVIDLLFNLGPNTASYLRNAFVEVR